MSEEIKNEKSKAERADEIDHGKMKDIQGGVQRATTASVSKADKRSEGSVPHVETEDPPTL